MSIEAISSRVEKFRKVLEEIAKFKVEQKGEELIRFIGIQIGRLTGTTPSEFRVLNETGLQAALLKQTPGWLMPCKKAMLITLLTEVGDYASLQKPPAGGKGWYLKALHLSLDPLAQDSDARLDFVPTLEALLHKLSVTKLPLKTYLLLMREYERTGRFNKLKEQFERGLQEMQQESAFLNLGLDFFTRLQRKPDESLIAGNLARSDLDHVIAKIDILKGMNATAVQT